MCKYLTGVPATETHCRKQKGIKQGHVMWPNIFKLLVFELTYEDRTEGDCVECVSDKGVSILKDVWWSEAECIRGTEGSPESPPGV